MCRVWVTLVALACFALPARAEPTGEEHFARGRELMAKREYVAACQHFAQAVALTKKLGAILNLAQCREKTGELVEATQLMWRGETQAIQEALQDYAVFARSEATRLQASLPRVEVHLDPSLVASARVRAAYQTRGAVKFEANAQGIFVANLDPSDGLGVGAEQPVIEVDTKRGRWQSPPLRLRAHVTEVIEVSTTQLNQRGTAETRGPRRGTRWLITGGALLATSVGVSIYAKSIEDTQPSQAKTTARWIATPIGTVGLGLLGWGLYQRYTTGPKTGGKVARARALPDLQVGRDRVSLGLYGEF